MKRQRILRRRRMALVASIAFIFGFLFNNIISYNKNDNNYPGLHSIMISAITSLNRIEDVTTYFTSVHSENIYTDIRFEEPSMESNLNTIEGVDLDVDNFNEHIMNHSPSDSPFIGKGEMFINIGKLLDVNPYYIYAHATLESGHGKSNFAVNRGNYFGIAAYNHNPGNAMHLKGDSMFESIYNGVEWIKSNYFEKGQDTLELMLYGDKRYAVYDDGSPNTKWANDILKLMS